MQTHIKRTPLTGIQTQNRGGVGQKGSTTRNEDFWNIYLVLQPQYMLFL